MTPQRCCQSSEAALTKAAWMSLQAKEIQHEIYQKCRKLTKLLHLEMKTEKQKLANYSASYLFCQPAQGFLRFCHLVEKKLSSYRPIWRPIHFNEFAQLARVPKKFLTSHHASITHMIYLANQSDPG